MKFQRICEQLCPADQEAIELYAGLHDGDVVQVEVVFEKRRSGTQNNCLHQWLSQLAKTLNEAGLDMRAVLKPTVDIPWTKDSAKAHLWKPVQIAMTGKDSTTKPTTVEYSKIYETITRHLASKHGIEVPPWPSIR